MVFNWLRGILEWPAHAVRYYQGRLRVKLLGSNLVGLLADTKRGLFLVDPEDMGVGRALVQYGEYGEHEIGLICALTDQRSSVLFVGAHVGALALPVSEHVASVTAVEANPQTFRLLSANISMRGRSNVRALQFAASDRKAPLKFVLNKTNSGGSKRMPVQKLRKYFYDNPSVVTVDGDRLDDVLTDEFDLIVMDLEGSEYYALLGMPRILARASHLIVEFLPHHLTSVAGVSLDEFLATIEPFFGELYIPSKQLQVGKAAFGDELTRMYEAGASDDGIVFSKKRVGASQLAECVPAL